MFNFRSKKVCAKCIIAAQKPAKWSVFVLSTVVFDIERWGGGILIVYTKNSFRVLYLENNRKIMKGPKLGGAINRIKSEIARLKSEGKNSIQIREEIDKMEL